MSSQWWLPVAAVFAGTAHRAYDPVGGNIIWIDHGSGLISYYAHLSAFSVAERQSVSQGDQVGLSGNTGSGDGKSKSRA